MTGKAETRRNTTRSKLEALYSSYRDRLSGTVESTSPKKVEKTFRIIKKLTNNAKNREKIRELCDEILSFYEYVQIGCVARLQKILECLEFDNYPNVFDEFESEVDEFVNLAREILGTAFKKHFTEELRKLVDLLFNSLFPNNMRDLSLCLSLVLGYISPNDDLHRALADMKVISTRGVRRLSGVDFAEVTDEELSSEKIRDEIAQNLFRKIMDDLLRESKSWVNVLREDLVEVKRRPSSSYKGY